METPYWWRDKERLKEAVEKHGNLSEAARATGAIPQTLSVWWRKHGFGSLPVGAVPKQRTVDPTEPVSHAEILQQRVDELEKALASTRKEDVLAERLVGAIRETVEAKKPSYSPKVIPAPRKTDEHEMALLWSDTHAGEVVKAEEVNGMNAYDWRVMMRRHDGITRGVLSYVHNRPYPVRRLHVWALGDMLSGNIHQELRETNEWPIMEVAVQFGLDAAEWLEQLASEFEDVRVAGVVGNHPRQTQKPQSKGKFDNFDWMAYHVMAQRLSASSHVRFEIPKAQKWPVEICGRRVLLTHGDGVRSTMVGVPWGGILRQFEKLANQYQRIGLPLDHLACGHWHQASVVNNRRVLVNGSVKGIDEYGLDRHGGGEQPHQLLVTFHPKRGMTDVSYLDLE